MTNVLDIELENIKFGLSDWDDENGYWIPCNLDVTDYKQNIIRIFNKYKIKLKDELDYYNDLNQIIKYDVILFYLYDCYKTNSSEDVINFNFKIDEQEIVGLWLSNYMQDLGIEYPKVLKLVATWI